MTSFEFYNYVLDLRQGRLRRDGIELALRRKAFQLLAYMLQNAGRVLSRTELLDAIWPRVIVSDDSLTQCVKDIRNALGKDVNGLIRTVPRRGYIADESRIRLVDDTTPVGPALDKPSIAVLPFHNLSSDLEQEYFAEGIVEEIIAALSRMRSLFVIARNSSFTFKGRAIDVKQVGRKLGVRYILEGSVRRDGSHVRIMGQLVDTNTGRHLWADSFEGVLDQVFELQDQVASKVIGAIMPRLEAAEIERVQRKTTASLDAYHKYLRGMAGYHKWSREGNDEALAYFYDAMHVDADYGAAYGMAARTYVQRIAGGWLTDPARELEEASRLAARAADIGRDDAVALAAAGLAIADIAGRIEEGDALVEKALHLNPNLAWAWLYSCWIKTALGEPEVALDRIARARRLSPNDPHTFSFSAAAAFAHIFAGQHEEAYASAQVAVRERPGFLLYTAIGAVSSVYAGHPGEAAEAVSLMVKISPGLRVSTYGAVYPFRRSSDLAKWIDGLRAAGLPA